MFKDRRLVLIFAISLVDVIAAGALGALLTKFVKDLPAEPVWLTGGTALMLAVQLGFSPAIGHWSDKMGRRPVAIITTIASLFVVAAAVTNSGLGVRCQPGYEGRHKRPICYYAFIPFRY